MASRSARRANGWRDRDSCVVSRPRLTILNKARNCPHRRGDRAPRSLRYPSAGDRPVGNGIRNDGRSRAHSWGEVWI